MSPPAFTISLYGYMVGSRRCSASSTIRTRSARRKRSANRTSASGRSLEIVANSKFALARQRMIGDIEWTQREVAHETGRPVLDRKVLAVMGDVPRHVFNA